jgi:hypothetical protein
MLIRSYGLFWDRDEVDWAPGKGNSRHLWGRRNSAPGTLRVADAWNEKGLYVLYSNTGPYYVGLVRNQALGTRLAQHTLDTHKKNWVRFSWFGFYPLTDDPWAVNVPDHDDKPVAATVDDMIGEMEALLIKSMGTFNLKQMSFKAAQEWKQIWYQETEEWLAKIGR